MSFMEDFANPPAPFRGKPFWAWNGRLDPEELRRQVRIFKEMGMGGAFLHSRVGLATPYLGPEWFDAIRAAIDECRAAGMEAWLYDEDCWPSGYAGGLATAEPAHRMKFLVMEIVPARKYREADWDGEFPLWEADVRGDRVFNLAWLRGGQRPKAGHVLLFHVETQPCSSWFNGMSYLDTLSETAVRAFIDCTHERYRREIGEEFGGVVPGIFTDEPNYCGIFGNQIPQGRKGIPYAFVPWTDKLQSTFETMFSYSLRGHLPELMLEVDGVKLSRARLDYRNCITNLFTVNFAKQVADWCDEQGIMLTGHLLLEELLHTQTLVVGSAMRFYEHMQAPGIDMLGQFGNNFDVAKQCQSVANQTGRKWMLSELYGCTGWDFDFEGHKAVGDWQAALGVNLRCHHLAWYTMMGEAKRDYPASIFFQSAWWEQYHHVEDYFSRINVAMSEGECVQRLLVIHPIESMFARFRPRLLEHGQPDQVMMFHEGEETSELDRRAGVTRDILLQNHLDYAYADEEMLGRLGAVSARGCALNVGRGSYNAVLVPPVDTLRASTVRLLESFRAAGGTVVFAGEAPLLVDGFPDDSAALLAEYSLRVPHEEKPIIGALAPVIRDVSVTDAKGREIPSVLYQLRRTDSRHLLFLCNTDRFNGFDQVTVTVRCAGKVVEHDPATGGLSLIPSTKRDGWTTFRTKLPATGSRLFVFHTAPVKNIPLEAQWKTVRRASLKRFDCAQLSEPNVLVLDFAEHRIGERGGFAPALEILKVDRRVRTSMRLPCRGGEMMQPWAREVSPESPRQMVMLRFAFQVNSLPQGSLSLAMETPGRFVTTLNGHYVNPDKDSGWWVDPCLRRIPIDNGHLLIGENLLECVTDFREDDNLEALYLLGDFGVELINGRPVMMGLRPPAGVGDWRDQQLPFYGGAVSYRYRIRTAAKPGERVVLQVAQLKGAMVRVLVNGREAGVAAWPPYEVDLTPHLDGDRHDLTLEVFGTRRNTFGPLHFADPNPPAIGPEHFVSEGEDWTDSYVLKPAGLLDHPVLMVQRKG